MGQSEVIDLLKKNPRLMTKEIAEALETSQEAISRTVNKLLEIGELKAELPTEEEKAKIIEKYPNSIFGFWCIKVFEVDDE